MKIIKFDVWGIYLLKFLKWYLFFSWNIFDNIFYFKFKRFGLFCNVFNFVNKKIYLLYYIVLYLL